MLFQETQLDDGTTIDSRSCGTTNTTTASSYDSNKVKVTYENKKKNVSTKHKNHFLLLCESCFWCASSIYTNSNNNNIMNRICPVCNNIKVESISIQNNEKRYKFDYIKDLQLS